MQRFQVVALVSGGKDSTMNMMRCVEHGHTIACLGNLFPAPSESCDELDSFMYQTVGHDGIEAIAACMELPLYRRPIQRKRSINQELEYTTTDGDEVEDLFALLQFIKQQHPQVNAVATGAILSNYQRTRVEAVCMRLGLVSLAFLWQGDQAQLLDEMIGSGIEAKLIKIACMGLTARKHLGRSLQEVRDTLHRLHSDFGAHICGEGGEFETFTTDCPLYKARIIMEDTEAVTLSDDDCAPVAYLKCGKWRLETKPPSTCPSRAVVHVVSDEEAAAAAAAAPKRSPPSDTLSVCDAAQVRRSMVLLPARTARDTSAGDALQEASIAAEAKLVLESIHRELICHGLDWKHVTMMGVYLTDMSDFAEVNEVYSRFLPIRCPASRVCVGLPTVAGGSSWAQGKSGRAPPGQRVAMECSAWPQEQSTLHVQSISRWAPSNIGPYSQAKTLGGMMVFVSGQIALDPATMTLLADSAPAQAEQCLRNLEAILGVCDSSLGLAVRVTIFLTSMAQAASVLRVWNDAATAAAESAGATPSCSAAASVSFVQVASLPRGALVEFQVSALTKRVATEGETQQDISSLSTVTGGQGEELQRALGEDWQLHISGTGSGSRQSGEGWCAATAAVSSAIKSSGGGGTSSAPSDAYTSAGRALGVSLRAHMSRHLLRPSHIVSLRLVTSSPDPAVPALLRSAFLDSIRMDEEGKEPPSEHECAGDPAAPAEYMQATVISAPVMAVSSVGEDNVREVPVLVEMVALAMR